MQLNKQDWQTVSFGDVVFQGKGTVDPKSSGVERYIAGEHMVSEDLHIRQWGTVGDGYLGPAFHRSFEKGDILYGSRRTYLKKVAIADFDGITSNTTFVIKENLDLVVPGFIPFLMLSDRFTEHSIKNSKGSVNPYINFKDITKFNFLLPPRNQQVRLAELLCAADECCTKEQERIEKIELLGSSYINEHIQAEIGKSFQLSSIIDRLDAGVCVSYGSENVGPNDYGLLTTTAVSSGLLNPHESKKVDTNDIQKLRVSVRANSIIISRINTSELVGANAYCDNDYDNIYLPDRLWQAVITRTDINVKYLWYILSSKYYRTKISNLSSGTSDSMKYISKDSFLGLTVRVPNLEQQNHVVQEMERIDKEIQSCKKMLKLTRSAYSEIRNNIFS